MPKWQILISYIHFRMHIHLLFHSQGSNDGKFIQLIAAPTAGQTYEHYGYVFTLDGNISI
ncbi:hypothetical protein E2R55_16975 [Vibrio vulnificus]|nr:hypothetical protein E2R55_16975 [Vibrio vulnificus]